MGQNYILHTYIKYIKQDVIIWKYAFNLRLVTLANVTKTFRCIFCNYQLGNILFYQGMCLLLDYIEMKYHTFLLAWRYHTTIRSIGIFLSNTCTCTSGFYGKQKEKC